MSLTLKEMRRLSVSMAGVVFLLAGGVKAATAPGNFHYDSPVTPCASKEAQSLLAYFADVYGKKIISGQQDGAVWPGQPDFEFDLIEKTTGKLPAIRSLEMAGFTHGEGPAPKRRPVVTERAIDWYTKKKGIVALCWHWHAPSGPGGIYATNTPFDVSKAVEQGTAENAAVLRDFDLVAAELEKLRDAGVPVLWRPLHEANGRWFWWGRQGPDAFRALWRLMFEQFAVKHKLNNLIWVFSPGSATDLAGWYPGDEYVDIIGQDHYPMDGNNGPATDVFKQLVAFGHGNKLVGLSENGPIPDPDLELSEKAGWLSFVTWSGRTLTEKNTAEQLKHVYGHPYVLTLEQLPELKNYPFAPAGKAVGLKFASPPDELAVGSPGRQPVTVAVVDEQGRTVRTGEFRVSLALAKNPWGGSLTGVPTVRTVNGIATFSDVRIDKAGAGYVMRASAAGLSGGESTEFAVGPGGGILREWWTNVVAGRLRDLPGEPALASAPSGKQVVGAALEVPCVERTNFVERFRGGISAPRPGEYVFQLVSDGVSELYLSTDRSPEKKVKIVEITGTTPYSKWPHSHEAWSAPVKLEANQQYYLEIWHLQKGGLGQLWVSWRRPDGIFEQPIPGAMLSRLADARPKMAARSETTMNREVGAQ